MPKVIDDGFAEELKRQYYQLRDRVDRLDRDMATRQKFAPREDFVLLQASTTGNIPAVTASTTGITPGKSTVAKMLTINSSDKAVRNTSDRSVTVYNLGGAIASGNSFVAHREFLTGRFTVCGQSEHRWAKFRVDAALTTTTATVAGVMQTASWSTATTTGTVTLKNHETATASVYIFSGSSGAWCTALYRPVDKSWHIVQMECP